MVKCMVHNEFCELHMCDTNEMGKCPVGEEFAPHLPDSFAQNAPHPSDPAPQFPGMCEVCGTQAAETGDFICMECISRMLVEME